MSHIEIQNYHRCFGTYIYNGITEEINTITNSYVLKTWQYKQQVYSHLIFCTILASFTIFDKGKFVKMARH